MEQRNIKKAVADFDREEQAGRARIYADDLIEIGSMIKEAGDEPLFNAMVFSMKAGYMIALNESYRGEPTLNEIREICSDLAYKDRTDRLKAALQVIGAEKLQEIDPADYSLLKAMLLRAGGN